MDQKLYVIDSVIAKNVSFLAKETDDSYTIIGVVKASGTPFFIVFGDNSVGQCLLKSKYQSVRPATEEDIATATINAL